MAVMFGLEPSPKGLSTVIGPLTICKWLKVFVINNLLLGIYQNSSVHDKTRVGSQLGMGKTLTLVTGKDTLISKSNSSA